MHCYICDTFMEDPKFDRNGKTLPCTNCQTEIDEALAGYGDDFDVMVDWSFMLEEEDDGDVNA